MIANEQEYRITQQEAERFRQALVDAEAQSAHLPPDMRQLMKNALAGQLQTLEQELAEYVARQRLRPAGRPAALHTPSPRLPAALLLGRNHIPARARVYQSRRRPARSARMLTIAKSVPARRT